jgi:hypothetical protein
MSDQNQRQSGKVPKNSDTEADLQEELRREAAEGGDSVGDVGSNRTLSGSSSWETLPSQEENDATDDSAAKGTNDD